LNRRVIKKPRFLMRGDNKDKDSIAEGDIEKLIRNAKEQGTPVAIVLAKDESQLRQLDKDSR
jgi:hypothetical protein